MASDHGDEDLVVMLLRGDDEMSEEDFNNDGEGLDDPDKRGTEEEEKRGEEGKARTRHNARRGGGGGGDDETTAPSTNAPHKRGRTHRHRHEQERTERRRSGGRVDSGRREATSTSLSTAVETTPTSVLQVSAHSPRKEKDSGSGEEHVASATSTTAVGGPSVSSAQSSASSPVPLPPSHQGKGRGDGPARYFVVKSNNFPNVKVSQTMGVWATQKHNEETLNSAFRVRFGEQWMDEFGEKNRELGKEDAEDWSVGLWRLVSPAPVTLLFGFSSQFVCVPYFLLFFLSLVIERCVPYFQRQPKRTMGRIRTNGVGDWRQGTKRTMDAKWLGWIVCCGVDTDDTCALHTLKAPQQPTPRQLACEAVP
eukprot:TRINITY_DN111_c0_g3_i1.p1 TRINITY_DN111_c0_g3~~TRINITY_DN111_c0_g3_i1.p1  ORF type:complete len:430 (-),score=82.18 TRINITY_DN111_c0_g3_i1:775-1872(-)